MAGRGNKGDGSRSGRKHKTYFEGGQTPLTRRVPKRGFENIFRKRYQIVNLRDLAAVASHEGEIDAKVLHAQGLIHSADLPVKVLGTGDAGRPLAVKADAFSKAAQEKLKPVKATTR